MTRINAVVVACISSLVLVLSRIGQDTSALTGRASARGFG